MPVVSWLPGPPSRLVRRIIGKYLAQPRFGLFTHGAPEAVLAQEMGYVRGRDFEVIEPGVALDRVAPGASDRAAPRRALGLGADALLGMTTARLVPVKNLAMLLRGIALARDRGADWHWLVAGDGPDMQSLRRLARELGLQDHVRFLGHQTQEEVYRWLSVADVFALTSHYENFSIAVLEAMAHGLPVIGTRVGYLLHLIARSGGGMAIPPESPESLAACLAELATDTRRRHELGEQGRRFVRQLDWPRIAERLERFHLRVIEGRQP
jgi:phosphatidylinositol alpha-1,6-mannosyltransferase